MKLAFFISCTQKYKKEKRKKEAFTNPLSYFICILVWGCRSK